MTERAGGLTLIELLVGLIIIGLLTSWAGASFKPWLDQRRADLSLSALRAAVNTARHAAIRRASIIIVCPAPSDLGPEAGCGRRNSWHEGVLVFHDENRNRHLDPTDNIIARIPGPEGGQVVWRSFRNRSYLRFTPKGLTDWQNGHFQYCPDAADATLARQLVLNVAGRSYPSRDTDGDGVHEDASGAPLRC